MELQFELLEINADGIEVAGSRPSATAPAKKKKTTGNKKPAARKKASPARKKAAPKKKTPAARKKATPAKKTAPRKRK